MFASWISPSLKALTVSGPPESSIGVKDTVTP